MARIRGEMRVAVHGSLGRAYAYHVFGGSFSELTVFLGNDNIFSSAEDSKLETCFVVCSASAKMPGNCWGRYRRVALVEVVRGTRPKMISSRARGVVRIVRTWEALNVGKSARCAYARAVAVAEKMAYDLNGIEKAHEEALVAHDAFLTGDRRCADMWGSKAA